MPNTSQGKDFREKKKITPFHKRREKNKKRSRLIVKGGGKWEKAINILKE